MLSIKKNLTKILVTLFFIAVPVFGFAMDSGDENSNAKALVKFPQRVATRITDGTTFVMQQAWDHPKITIVMGTTVCAAIVFRRYIATQKDLNATKERLNEHRENEGARLVALKDTHDKDITQKYNEFGGRQNELVRVLATAGTNAADLRIAFLDLLKQSNLVGANQGVAFQAIRNVLNQSATTSDKCVTDLGGMLQTVAQDAKSQGTMQQNMVILLRNVGTVKSDMQALIEQMRKSGQDTTQVELEMAALLKELNAQYPELKDKLPEDTRVEILSDDYGTVTSNSNNNNE